jgi:hypothetical protein
VLFRSEQILEHSGSNDLQQLASLVSSQFSCDPLLPEERQVDLSDATFSIERATNTAPSGAAAKEPARHPGVRGLSAALSQLLTPFKAAMDIHCKFKLFRVARDGDTVVTEQYVALSGRTSEGMIEQNATWVIHWKEAADKTPKLVRIYVSDFEQVVYKQEQGTIFADCTLAALGANECYKNQFLRGRNHWLNQSQDTRYTYLLGTPALAMGDVNGDGLDDFYVCQEEGLPNRLFLQNADGTATDASDAWGVNWLHNSRGALLVDLDNDGDQDLVVAMVGFLIVASNEQKEFKIQAVLPTDEDSMSLCSADYDNDGDLDIYVCSYNANDELSGTTRGGLLGGVIADNTFDRPNGGRNTLFRNDVTDSKWQFTDVTQEVGLVTDVQPLSLAASWEDYDNDGDQDLYVANDYGNNQFFRNDGGSFTEVSVTSGTQDQAFGMSVAWGDYNRNGWMDLYVSNMFSAAGNRVTFQPRFLRESPLMKKRLQRFARGNTLMRNDGLEKGFTDVSQESAVTVGRWAWSSSFVDINNDGWEDLIVANGYVTTDDTGDL